MKNNSDYEILWTISINIEDFKCKLLEYNSSLTDKQIEKIINEVIINDKK